MRICLITNVYPANDIKDVDSTYVSELASGLNELGHEVTVLCAKSLSTEVQNKIRIVVAAPAKNLGDLSLSRRKMPGSVHLALQQIGFWQAFSEIGGGQAFDVVETCQSLAGTLLSAFSKETAAVLRVNAGDKTYGNGFDEEFQSLISGYAYACVDRFSCASDEDATYLQRTRKIEPAHITVNSSQKAKELAQNASTIYDSAIRHFAVGKKPHLYRHGALKLIKSTEDMILLYDRMLYDLLFRVSYRFRFGHWLRQLRSDPKAFTDRVLQRFSKST